MKKITIPAFALLLAACAPKAPSAYDKTDSVPAIFPDYTDVTIPRNIAPMNFLIEDDADSYITVLKSGSAEYSVKGSQVRISQSKWKELTNAPEINVQVYARKNGKWTAYAPFKMIVSDEIDPYISYRIIPVAVESYEKLTIRQRNITNFMNVVTLKKGTYYFQR